MSKIAELSDPQYVSSQYRDASNLNTRIRLHQRFSTNKYGWFRWVYDQFSLPSHCRILELGCGPGDLWLENLDRLLGGWELVLSDFSPGMVGQAQSRLGEHRQFCFATLDAQSIPFESHCFGAVIANHMLFHLPDRERALAEIRRVLKPDGRFYASTNGAGNLNEISVLLGKFNPRLASWGDRLSHAFTLENGAAQLTRWFRDVMLRRYPDAFVITEAPPLVDFILSGALKLSPDQQGEFPGFVEREIRLHGGKFHISKDTGIFKACAKL